MFMYFFGYIFPFIFLAFTIGGLIYVVVKGIKLEQGEVEREKEEKIMSRIKENDFSIYMKNHSQDPNPKKTYVEMPTEEKIACLKVEEDKPTAEPVIDLEEEIEETNEVEGPRLVITKPVKPIVLDED